MADKKGYYEQTDAQFKIRLPHELKEKIRASSNEYNRTMTADIVARLEQSFYPEGTQISDEGVKVMLPKQMYELVATYANGCGKPFDEALVSLLHDALMEANFEGFDKTLLVDALTRRLNTMSRKKILHVGDFIRKID